jgi:CRISPR-associated protein Cmr4
MTATTAILGLLAQTSLHAGAGSQTGIIDLPIQREGHNGWPCIFGSAVKGALRDKAEQQVLAKLSGEKPQDQKAYAEKVQNQSGIMTVFGPPPRQNGDSAGALIVTDARLLLFPVRSLTSQFKWVSCPDALRRYLADCKRLGLGLEVVFEIPEFDNPEDDQAIVYGQPESKTEGLFLEEYRFNTVPHDISALITSLAKLMRRDDARQALEKQLVIVSNDNFSHLVTHATPVNAHIALDALTKTTLKGALWYEETLPPETLLYTGLSANASRQENHPKSAAEILDQVLQLFKTHPYIQLGGNETVGMGWCIVKQQLGA